MNLVRFVCDRCGETADVQAQEYIDVGNTTDDVVIGAKWPKGWGEEKLVVTQTSAFSPRLFCGLCVAVCS